MRPASKVLSRGIKDFWGHSSTSAPEAMPTRPARFILKHSMKLALQRMIHASLRGYIMFHDSSVCLLSSWHVDQNRALLEYRVPRPAQDLPHAFQLASRKGLRQSSGKLRPVSKQPVPAHHGKNICDTQKKNTRLLNACTRSHTKQDENVTATCDK